MTNLYFVMLTWAVSDPSDPFGDEGRSLPKWAPTFIPADSEEQVREFVKRAGYRVTEIKCVSQEEEEGR